VAKLVSRFSDLVAVAAFVLPSCDVTRYGTISRTCYATVCRRDARTDTGEVTAPAAAWEGKNHMSLTGGCLCGAVAYEVTGLDGPIVHCHCRTCRKAHASAFTSTARVLRTHFRWLRGKEKINSYESSPGKKRHFCGVCGSHMVAERAGEEHVILRVATLDEDPLQTPAMHIWTSHDAAWLCADGDVPQFAETPSNADRQQGTIADIRELLAALDPELSGDEVVFCTFPTAAVDEILLLAPIGWFIEREGVTAIVLRSSAEQAGIPFTISFRAITLNVHSSLEAVGLTAAVTARLAQHGISANVVAAYHHDHIFVPAADAARAMDALQALQVEAGRSAGPAVGGARAVRP